MLTANKFLFIGLRYVAIILAIAGPLNSHAQQAANANPAASQPLLIEQIPSGSRLKDIPVTGGFKIGVTVGKTAAYGIPEREFSEVTVPWFPNFGGWAGINSYNFSFLNQTVNWSHAQGKTTVMHMLVGYDKYLPEWLVKGKWTNKQLDTMMRNMIYALMDSNDNKNKIDVFNVANELFNDDGTYRTNMVYNQLGWEDDASGLTGAEQINKRHPVFIGKAFQYARNKTTAKLELRDYNITMPAAGNHFSKKHAAVYQLLKHMLAKKYPVDAVGEQAHFNIGTCPELTGFVTSIKKFKALGIDMYLSELDVAINAYSNPKTWNDAAIARQKLDYKTYVRSAIDAGVNLINIWGIKDSGSWVPAGHPLLFDDDGNAKPAYYGVQEALLNK